eukprot:TRINITY_DN252_c3_g1_i1.p1 TRINITY_DN252_c3_g1~~TRINITY_DN252_c3_g1_i1.p1  ORF type:complete len:424 (-),score=204.52 TRINITY_DN252_c3_g1_i1:70-1341(-)
MTTENKRVNHYENLQTDLFTVIKFHSLEYTVGDAKITSMIFKKGLGMKITGVSNQETGNHTYTSYILEAADVKFILNSPYLYHFQHPDNKVPNPSFDSKRASSFWSRHGNGVSTINIEVSDATQAFKVATENGAKGVVNPTEIKNETEEGRVVISEIELYNDYESTDPLHHGLTTLRFIQYDGFNGPFLPGYKKYEDETPFNYGLSRIDHVVGNVYNMDRIISNLKKWIGFHTFAKFTKEEIQTRWTSLNSEVLANNNLKVLLPINEPAPGKKESQIIEYLKAYNGPGVQHIALKSFNVFSTVAQMKVNSITGFEFIPTPSTYYEDPYIILLLEQFFTPEERASIQQHGILIDRDDEGVLLQIFTKPLFDRPTLFIEIIQRRCYGEVAEIPGCGGFGKGNFKALFESIERLQELRGGLLPTNA